MVCMTVLGGVTVLVEMVVAGVESIGLGLKILSVWSGNNRVWRLISFVMSPSKGMKSMHQEGASAGFSFSGAYDSLKLYLANSRDHLACLCCIVMKYSRFL